MARKRQRVQASQKAADRRPEAPAAATPAPAAAAPASTRLRDAALLLALIVPLLAVYQPAWAGTLLWDDVAHLTAPALRTLHGLWRIWFEPGATQQYYPLLHSAFWLQYKVWGDATLGYHLVNIVLHGCSAFLVALILRRLAIPGAWLAAAIFALHPVQAESVAWIAELKNTLSGTLGLGAVYIYLGFDCTGEKRRYALAMLLFVLALATKSVTAMLPVMVLVALWWKHGRLSWRRHVLPLTPFLAVGAAAGLTTAVIERTVIGAAGAEYNFTVVERCLIAGRAIWFYLRTLVWPSHLVFIYPRWSVSQAVWWQYLYPIAAALLIAAAWAARGKSRAPLAAILAFSAGLFPALGFFNVYPFRYAFVADHFQYLATIPVVALFAAGLARLASTIDRQRPKRLAVAGSAALILLVLGTLTFRESRKYANATRLYEATLRDNPACWLAEVNLGKTVADTGGSLEVAVRHFNAALVLQPNLPEAHYNLGLAYHKMGRLAEAVASYEGSLREGPDLAETHVDLCAALRAMGRLPEARTACERAVALAPDSAAAQFGLGATLRSTGDLDAALAALVRAGRLAPERGEIYAEMGTTLRGLGRGEEAATAYRMALKFGARSPESLASFGFVLAQQGQVNEAIGLYQEALRIDPRYTDARYYLGTALQSVGRLQEAVDQYKEALAVNPSDAAVHNNLGLALEDLGQPGEAVVHYREAVRLRPNLVQAQDNLRRVMSAPRPRR